MKKIYISGPMTGYDDMNFPAFYEMENKLKNYIDVEVVNPAKVSHLAEEKYKNPSYFDYLREDFRVLLDCDAVVMLTGWKESRGCMAELALAKALSIPFFEDLQKLEEYLFG